MAQPSLPGRASYDTPATRPETSLRFVSDAAHDLVGPINQVSSLVELFVRRYRNQLDDDAVILLGHIESAGAHLSATATGLSSYFKIAGRERPSTRVDAGEALQSALLGLRQEIRDAEADIQSCELPVVECDPVMLTRLWRELLANALKFRRLGVMPQIRIAAECSPGACRFSIADNGIGMEPQYREEVFRPLKKLNGHAYAGGGMGLAIARAIVDVCGGRIWVADSSELVTTLVFELVLAQNSSV